MGSAKRVFRIVVLITLVQVHATEQTSNAGPKDDTAGAYHLKIAVLFLSHGRGLGRLSRLECLGEFN
jgi:hypothetical protein